MFHAAHMSQISFIIMIIMWTILLGNMTKSSIKSWLRMRYSVHLFVMVAFQFAIRDAYKRIFKPTVEDKIPD